MTGVTGQTWSVFMVSGFKTGSSILDSELTTVQMGQVTGLFFGTGLEDSS